MECGAAVGPEDTPHQLSEQALKAHPEPDVGLSLLWEHSHTNNRGPCLHRCVFFHQPFHPYDLIPHRLDVLEALLVDKAVDQDEPLAVFDVQVPHGRELLGAGGVKDFQHRGRGVHLDLLAVKILYSGVVLLDERPGDELHGEGGLADPAAAQHHHFVLAHRFDRNPLVSTGQSPRVIEMAPEKQRSHSPPLAHFGGACRQKESLFIFARPPLSYGRAQRRGAPKMDFIVEIPPCRPDADCDTGIRRTAAVPNAHGEQGKSRRTM